MIHIWSYHADSRIHFHYMMDQFTVCLFVKDTGQNHPDLGCPGSLTVRTAYEHSKRFIPELFHCCLFQHGLLLFQPADILLFIQNLCKADSVTDTVNKNCCSSGLLIQTISPVQEAPECIT